MRICIYVILLHRAIGGVKILPPPLPYFSAFCVYLFGWIHLSLVHLFETNSWDPDLNKVGLMWGGSHKIKKGLQANAHKPLFLLVRPAGFEPATYGFVALISGTVGTSRDIEGFNYFK